MENKDLSEEINEKIENIRNRVLSREISLLDVELVPLFESLKESLTIYNINRYSRSYDNAFQLLSQKFEELKGLLNFLDNKEKFVEFLKFNPSDDEIFELFNGCWRETLNFDVLSLKFLELSEEKLCRDKRAPFSIESIDNTFVKGSFLLEVPTKRFTEKMMSFFDEIKAKLPCSYDEIFEYEHDQLKIYEKFVYLLHLLQINKIKYQKETKYLYL